MLQNIRDKVTGWLATAIIALLIVPFAFWGINYYFTGGQETAVATVNGEDISYSEFQRVYANYRIQMQNRLGRTLGPDDEDFLRQQILDRLVESRLLNQVTQEAGLRVSDVQVRETIKNIDVFKEGDRFNKDFYQQSVLRLGMPPALYEEQMRFDMMSEQLQSAIVESAFVPSQEAEFVARLTHQQRDFAYSVIPADRFRDTIEVTDSDIEKFYKENPDLYTKPEQVRIAYIDLSLEQLAKSITVDEEDLRNYYQTNKAAYDSEEQRKVTQILIKADDENISDEKLAQAKAGADKILDQIRAGKTFEDIAKDHADNKDTDFSLSEYGFLAKGIHQPEVDESAFAMQTGEVSDVIRSKLGFHIIRLEDIKGGMMNTFENSRDEVERDYRNKQAEQRFFDLADQLANLAYEHPDTLEIAAEETGQRIQESELFDRNSTGEGITANPKVISASFSDDVLTNRHNSELIEISDRELLVLRVIEHAPRAVRPLEEVREAVINDIRFAEASNRAYETGQRIIDALKSNNNLTMVANQENIEWTDATDVKRDDVSVNRSILRYAFRMPQPRNDEPGIGGVSLGTGDYAVIVMQAVRDPEPDSIKDTEIEQTRRQLFSNHAAASWQQSLEQLKADASITLYRDRLQ